MTPSSESTIRSLSSCWLFSCAQRRGFAVVELSRHEKEREKISPRGLFLHILFPVTASRRRAGAARNICTSLTNASFSIQQRFFYNRFTATYTSHKKCQFANNRSRSSRPVSTLLSKLWMQIDIRTGFLSIFQRCVS